ncbi:MAG: ACT domain-containing protein [Pseudomonadota bacterium]
MTVVADRLAMIRGMSPRLLPGCVAFRTLGPGEPVPRSARGWFREDEGVSVIEAAHAGQAGAMRQITLDLHSSLDGVGLTAAVAGALAEAGIACNMVAAHHHDHAFVPEADAERALEILQTLARTAE